MARQSEFLCVVGSSGCGKSTMLLRLAAFTLPTSGEVRFQGARTERNGDPPPPTLPYALRIATTEWP
ncbi:ATP-binding cassette domain-containing protein [Mesorhizobium sp. ANAO-SY3R2]|uniref:ATP-binding cassette domain-containing protein n=1 Tax=Mesorhizobium sp. ANAO-SY3R2 TaxID=3166644 RepID=UPI00366EA055